MKPLVIAACAMIIAVHVSAAPAPPAATIQGAIEQRGAKAVVDELWRQDRWDAVSDQIAKGGRAWLALVPILATGTDGGPSEDLGIDLARALLIDPAAVLRVTDEQTSSTGGIIGIARVCGRPFMEDTEPTNYLRKAVRAVRSVTEPSLAQKKSACLNALRHTAAKPR